MFGTKATRCCCVLVSQQRAWCRILLCLLATSCLLNVVHAQAELQEPVATADFCQICSREGSSLEGDKMVTLPLLRGLGVMQLQDDLLDTRSSTNNMTCAEWQTSRAAFHPSNSLECRSYRNWLMEGCCSGLPPFYSCQQAVKKFLFPRNDDRDDPYDASIGPSPLPGGIVNVTITPVLHSMTVMNPGSSGGSLSVQGQLILMWHDPRLQWDPIEFECTETWVRASLLATLSDIWVPTIDTEGLTTTVDLSGVGNTAHVQLEGNTARVKWQLSFEREVPCTTLPLTMGKQCSILVSSTGPSSSNYQALNFITLYPPDGLDMENAIPGYRLVSDLSNLHVVDDTDIVLSFVLEPTMTNCPICGGLDNVELLSNAAPTSQNIEGGLWPEMVGRYDSTCQQLNDFMLTIPVTNPLCEGGRSLFFDKCCLRPDDTTFNRRQCEHSLHTYALEGAPQELSIPPALSKGTIFTNYTPEVIKEVSLHLDLEQVLGIDIKSNTMEVLVSLEILWTDDALAWDPFIGGCYATSYRASLDPEQTEIWVPEIDLINQVEGTQGLPTAHASVSYTGLVWWRRTGVLKVACELTGVRMFPFDRPSCYMDFGTSRDPIFHPINYSFATIIPTDPVEFSARLIEKSAKYQEYEVDTDDYHATIETFDVSGYKSNRIRFQFYFSRATAWYMLSFVLLYIIFTYLSFGMFLLDHQVGERLAFGTSILFIMLAQDITMSEYTPVAHIRLWIDYISLASKAWVIFGILESLAIIYLAVVIPTLKHQSLDHQQLPRDSTVTKDCHDEDSSSLDLDDPEAMVKIGASFMKRQKKCSIFDKAISYRPNADDPKALQRYKKLRTIDTFMCRFFFISYTFYVGVMAIWAMTADKAE